MPSQLPVPPLACPPVPRLPTHPLAPAQMPREQHRTSPLPPHRLCLSLARDKPVAEQLVGFPQPWTSWDYLFLSEQPLVPATPRQHLNQPHSFCFMSGCCHQKRQSQRSWAVWGHGGGCLHKNPSSVPPALPSPAKPRASYL